MSQEEANGIARAVERMRRSRRKGLKFALPTVAALGAGTALAVGAIPGNDGTITGCYVTNTAPAGQPSGRIIGDLRLIDTSQSGTLPTGGPNPAGACISGEATITWNQHGPQGPAGVPGAQGPQGAPGPAGTSLVGQTSFGLGGGSGKTFLKLDGIKGESTAKLHKGEIEISSFSFGVSNAGTAAHGSGGGAGKTSFQSFTITKRLDKASPSLFQFAASGKHIQTASVFFTRKAGGEQLEYLKIKLTDVLISSLQQGQSGRGTPQEAITFNFKKAEESFLGSNGKVLQSVAVTITGNK